MKEIVEDSVQKGFRVGEYQCTCHFSFAAIYFWGFSPLREIPKRWEKRWEKAAEAVFKYPIERLCWTNMQKLPYFDLEIAFKFFKIICSLLAFLKSQTWQAIEECPVNLSLGVVGLATLITPRFCGVPEDLALVADP